MFWLGIAKDFQTFSKSKVWQTFKFLGETFLPTRFDIYSWLISKKIINWIQDSRKVEEEEEEELDSLKKVRDC